MSLQPAGSSIFFLFDSVIPKTVGKLGRATKHGIGFNTLNLEFHSTGVSQRPPGFSLQGAKLFNTSLFGQVSLCPI
jgi:hypothetical protein